MSKYLLTTILLVSSFALGQGSSLSNIAKMIRDDGNIYAWVYFADKEKSIKKVHISDKTISIITSRANFGFNPSICRRSS